jgi:hypothetical protein
MKVLVDMNLSPTWAPFLKGEGIEAVHWSAVGDPRALSPSMGRRRGSGSYRFEGQRKATANIAASETLSLDLTVFSTHRLAIRG